MLPATTKNLRSFGAILAGVLLVLAALTLWKRTLSSAVPVAAALAVASAVSAGLALLAPDALRIVYKPWMAVAQVLGVILSSLLLTVLYFTLLVPFTLIRLKDPLRARLGGATYWEPHKNPEPTLERFRRAF